jgi:ribosomal protein S1
LKGGNVIRGEVLRADGENYFVKQQNGKEVRVHIDETTEKPSPVTLGDRIEAEVNDQNHALSIIPLR